jgi:hypothetical protein
MVDAYLSAYVDKGRATCSHSAVIIIAMEVLEHSSTRAEGCRDDLWSVSHPSVAQSTNIIG